MNTPNRNDIAAMLKRFRDRLKVVIVANTDEELALARAGLPVRGLARHLPGVLAGRGAA
ncbi:MAG: hypothetical protein HS110_03300 [Zoogloeaceae bacterium]|nr:hypothetical protein [Zoogloeaceae bacterium]MCK6385875.1 hypothetical protein [Rhodocyclaceae bacterium]